MNQIILSLIADAMGEAMDDFVHPSQLEKAAEAVAKALREEGLLVEEIAEGSSDD